MGKNSVSLWIRFSAVLAFCGLFLFLPVSGRAAAPITVGYYGGWASYQGYTPEKIPADRLHNIHYAFASIDPSGRSLTLTDPAHDLENFRALGKLKAENKNVRLIISIGGWDDSAYFSKAAREENRKAFSKSCVDFLTEHSFDGVDLDWEYPVSGGKKGNVESAQDRENFTLLLRELRNALNAQGKKDGRTYSLSVAVGAEAGYLKKIQPKEVAELVDYLYIMGYDYHGGWDSFADLNAPLFTPKGPSPQYRGSVSDSIDFYLESGVPKEKLILGMPLYGNLYRGIKQSSGLYASYSTARSISYHEIAETLLRDPKAKRGWHSEAQVPYLFWEDKFLSYENVQSISAKAILARSRGLAGFGVWEISQDSGSALINAACNAWNSALPFIDVLPGQWHYEAVKKLWDRGAVSGTSQLTFSPNQGLNRAMFAQILYRLEGEPAAPVGRFTDVKQGAWYEKAVNWAASAELIQGYGNGCFGPLDWVTREQAALILRRYAEQRGYSTEGKGNVSAFPDGKQTSRWAADAVAWAVGEGIIEGKDGRLAPRERATRAESAVLLERLLLRLSKVK